MATMVGNEGDINHVVKNPIYLEHDTIAAYDSCIEHLDDTALSAQIATFKGDHLQHLHVLNEMARELGIEPPGEDDTVTASERAIRHEDAIPASKAFFMKAHQDEQRHRVWMETTAKT